MVKAEEPGKEIYGIDTLPDKCFCKDGTRKRAESFDMVYSNPSPSGDPWFDDLENIASLNRGIEEAKQGRTITMKPSETLDHFLESHYGDK